MCKRVLVIGACALVLGLTTYSTAALADSKHYFYNWHQSHWKYLDFKPYVENYAHTHRPMTRKQPYNYNGDLGPQGIIREFRAAQMLHKFYIDEDTGHSVAEVGPYFYDLSQSDKQKFLATVDGIYNVTRSDQRVLFLKDWNTKRDIGQYSPRGLMIF